MKVLATVAPQALWQDQLAQFGLVTVQQAGALSASEAQLLLPSQTPAELTVLLSHYPEAELAIAYEAPEHRLGRLLVAGETPAQAGAKWQAEIEALLQLQQQQRRRVKLFSLTAAASAENLTALPAWIKLHNDATPPEPADTVYTLLAAQLLRQLPELTVLQQRLFASSLPLLEHSDYQFNLAGLAAALSKNAELENLQQQLAATSDERDLVLQQLLHVQEELEQLFNIKTEVKQQYAKLQDTYQSDVQHLTAQLNNGQSKVAATSKQLTCLQAELERIAAAHGDSVQQLAATSDERDLLLLQLMQVQEELEQYYLKWQNAENKASHADTARNKQQQREFARLESQLRKTRARAAGAEHQLQLLQQQLDAVKNSTLWKTGAPVRVLTRLVKKTDKAQQKLQQEAALIITSEYFDIDWYLIRYPDVAAGKLNPAEHYLRFGASEGRMPGPLFDGDWYLQRYPDVATGGINPLLHFIKFGQQEGRTASPKLLTDHSAREE